MDRSEAEGLTEGDADLGKNQVSSLFGYVKGHRQRKPYVSHCEMIADDVSSNVAKALSKRYRFIPVGFGGRMHDDIEKMSLSFNSYQERPLEDYRKLIVESAEYYLKEINSNEKIKSYLHNFPFDANNIELSIFIFKNSTEPVDIGNITCVTVLNGNVLYSVRETEYSTKNLSEESFESAKRLVAKQKRASHKR